MLYRWKIKFNKDIYIYTYIQNKKNRETKILCMLKFKLYYDIPGLRYFW